MIQNQQIIAGRKSILSHPPRVEGQAPRIIGEQHRTHPQVVGDQHTAAAAPRRHLLQAGDQLQCRGIQADGTRRLADVAALEAAIADMGDNEGVCRRRTARSLRSSGKERYQLDLPQQLKRLLNRGNLLFQRTICTPQPGKMAWGYDQTALTPSVQTCDVGSPHFTDPKRVAAENPRIKVGRIAGPLVVADANHSYLVPAVLWNSVAAHNYPEFFRLRPDHRPTGN